jgi:hypothetical protein
MDFSRCGSKSDPKLAIDGGPTYYGEVCWAKAFAGKIAAIIVFSEVSPLVSAP